MKRRRRRSRRRAARAILVAALAIAAVVALLVVGRNRRVTAGRAVPVAAARGSDEEEPPGFFDVARVATWHSLRPMRGLEWLHGVGQVYAVPRRGTLRLVVRSAPADTAAVVCYVEIPVRPGAGLHYTAREAGLQRELYDAGDGARGFVADLVMGDWARVVYASTAAGEPRRGWIRLVSERVAYVSLEEQLTHRANYVPVSPAQLRFHSGPGGPVVPFSLYVPWTPPRDSLPSFDLQVLRIEGGWALVRVSVPGVDPCWGEQAAVIRSAELWLPLRDESGHYQIGFHTGDPCQT